MKEIISCLRIRKNTYVNNQNYLNNRRIYTDARFCINLVKSNILFYLCEK